MKITIEDDLGNVEILTEKSSRDHIFNRDSVQDFLTPCQGCGKIVLYSHARWVDGEFYCSVCKGIGDEVR